MGESQKETLPVEERASEAFKATRSLESVRRPKFPRAINTEREREREGEKGREAWRERVREKSSRNAQELSILG